MSVLVAQVSFKLWKQALVVELHNFLGHSELLPENSGAVKLLNQHEAWRPLGTAYANYQQAD
jgi:hypothetical protein